MVEWIWVPNNASLHLFPFVSPFLQLAACLHAAVIKQKLVHERSHAHTCTFL